MQASHYYDMNDGDQLVLGVSTNDPTYPNPVYGIVIAFSASGQPSAEEPARSACTADLEDRGRRGIDQQPSQPPTTVEQPPDVPARVAIEGGEWWAPCVGSAVSRCFQAYQAAAATWPLLQAFLDDLNGLKPSTASAASSSMS